jgi:hypothetical protein
LISGSLFAQDIVGRWTGVADTTDEAGTKRQEKHTFDIKNEDGKLSGQQMGRDGKPGRTLDVQVDGGKVNLYAYLTLDGGEHLRWKLELKDGSLVGTFSAQHNNPKKWQYDRLGAMTLVKGDPPAASK